MKKTTGTPKQKSTPFKLRKSFGLWQLKPAKPGKKPAKVPYYANGKPRSGDLDSPKDLAQLVTYDEAVAAAKKLNNGHGTVRSLKWRVALMITPGLVFIDLDGHRTPDKHGGQPSDYAQAWFDACPETLIEVSQSGTGYHIIGEYNGPPVQLVDAELGLEIYSGKRFCAWTGEMLMDEPPADLTAQVLAEVKPESSPAKDRQVTHEFSGPRWDEWNISKAVDALTGRSPACGYQEWRDVAFAIHDGFHGDEEGYEFFVAWSSGGFANGECPEGFDEAACRKLWRSIKPGRGVTKASLFTKPQKTRAKPGTPPTRKAKGAPPKPDKPSPKPTPTLPTGPVEIVAPAPSGEGEPEDLFVSGDVLHARAHRETVFPVPGMFSTGAALLVGRPKGGKTFLVTQLAHALSTGGEFLGEKCIKGRTLYIAAEDTVDSFRSRMVETMQLVPHRDLLVVDAEGLAKIADQYEDTSLDAWIEHCIVTKGITNVIIDTHASAEATWASEALTDARKFSPVEVAYQKTRVFENIAQRHGCLIVLLHHTRKRNGKDITDFHELINLPQTVVAGCSTSVVLADHPERDAYDDEDSRRVLARRGRQGYEFVLAMEFGAGGFINKGAYSVVQQTKVQSEVLTVLEAIQEGEDFVSYTALAAELGRHKQAVAQMVVRMKGNKTLMWKGRRIETKTGPGGGIRLSSI